MIQKTPFPTKEFKEAYGQITEMVEIVNILITDLRRVLDMADQTMKQLSSSPQSELLPEQETWIRLSNRLVITTIESICYKMKQISLLGFKIGGKELNQKDINKLSEKDEKGRPKFLPIEDNLKYSFEMYAKAFNSTYKLKFGKDWGRLQSVLKKRRGLTHPKQKSDLAVSKKDHHEAIDALNWLWASFMELLTSVPRPVTGL